MTFIQSSYLHSPSPITTPPYAITHPPSLRSSTFNLLSPSDHTPTDHQISMAASSPPPPPSTQPPQLDLCTVLTESKSIINAHCRHFLALSVLFLLPVSFSLSVFPTLLTLLFQSPSLNPKILSFFYLDPSHRLSPENPTILLSSLFSLFVLAFSLLATGSISYSVYHGFYGRPVKLVSAIESSIASFLRLLITVLLSQVLLIGILLLSGSLLFLVVQAFQFAGFEFELSSISSTALFSIFCIAPLVILVRLQLNWALVGVVVVVESSWGINPFKRSKLLMNGMQRVAFSLLLFFGFSIGLLVWATYLISSSFGGVGAGAGDGLKSWVFVLQIVQSSAMLVMLFLYYIAANTVLYMHCKAAQGELAWEIAEEFATEYVSLPFDDGKVPHLVSVVYT